MENRKLVAEPRIRKGSGEAGRLRREGWIPAVVYGPGEENLSVKIPERNLISLLREMAGQKILIQLDVGKDSKLVTIRDLQRDPVSGRVTHVDFLVIHEGVEVEVEVPVVPVGTAPGVKKGGILDVITRSLSLRSLPKNIPPRIEVDISSLEMGDVVHVRDISLPNVKITEDEDTPILSILAPRGLVEEKAPEEEILEPEEGAPGEDNQEGTEGAS